MSHWYAAKVSARRPEADGLTALDLDLKGTPLVGSHLSAGQYVKLAVEGVGESYFAIASAPDQAGERFELLLKAGSPLADALVALKPGEAVKISVPQGKGFPVEAARGKNLLLFATGSGISPIRSVVEVVRKHRHDFRDVTLYFGARTPQGFAYAGQLAAWEKDRIQVIRTVSQPGESGWSGLTGYVQHHLREVKPDTVAFLCGQKTMVQGVTEALTRLGLAKDCVFLNF